MSYYHLCACCGAALDPGEICTDCRDEKKTAPSATNTESGEADQKLSDPRSASILPNK